jgi:hypothetical protein
MSNTTFITMLLQTNVTAHNWSKNKVKINDYQFLLIILVINKLKL